MKTKYRKFDIYIKSNGGKLLTKRQQNGSIRERSEYIKAVKLSDKRNKQGWHTRLKFSFD